uniref:Suppressor of cytokine signaling 1-like n=1 Tax=Oncorhynchus kisutch TaxID=8019 RepID=A0A8C7N1E9_ONCKI
MGDPVEGSLLYDGQRYSGRNHSGTIAEPRGTTQNQDGTQQLPGETLEHVEQQNRVQEQQNQLLELENFELLGQENELLEQQNLEQQIQLLELENTVQTSTDNRSRPPDKTSSGGALHPWWPQQSSFRATRPSVPLPCLGPLLHFQQEYLLVRHTHRQLVHSGYYWGPMEMEEAHRTLLLTPPGSFLIRDSSQPDVFFTLSYHGDRGPVSVRVLLTSQSFRLNGSNKAFDSLFALLRFYVESSHRRLRRAWRREQPMTLQQLCRGRIVELYGAERIDSLPGLNQVVIQYLQDYPYSV